MKHFAWSKLTTKPAFLRTKCKELLNLKTKQEMSHIINKIESILTSISAHIFLMEKNHFEAYTW